MAPETGFIPYMKALAKTPTAIQQLMTPPERLKMLRASALSMRALVCLDRWGLEKPVCTISPRSGCNSPDRVQLFCNREEVIQAAMIQGWPAFGLKLLTHISQFPHTASVCLEAVLFAYKNMPKDRI